MSELEWTEPLRIAISGAAGRVAYSLIFRIAAGGMFGAEQPVILRCLDVPDRMQRLEALGYELFDCAFPLLVDYRATSNPDEAFGGADWIILLASRAGITSANHVEALAQNGSLYRDHGQAINRSAPTARILVVASPSHTNCLIALSHAPHLPPERWFALNRVYRMRATALIAQRAGVPVAHVNRVIVWGNPGPNLYVDVHNSFIGDTPTPEVLKDPDWIHGELQSTVGARANHYFLLAGDNPAATAAQAILGTIHSLITPTAFQHRFGAGVYSDGSYEIPRGLIFGFPLRTEDGRTWNVTRGLYVDDFAIDRLQKSVSESQYEAALAAEFLGDLP
jgi:malate dehydrogenase